MLLLAAVVAAGLVALRSIDFDAYREDIEAQVRAQTGRDLRIEGKLKLAIGLRPGVQVKGVSLANAEWGSRPQMVTLEHFVVRLKLLPLLARKVVVARLELSGLDVLLETRAEDGQGNWMFAPPEPAPEEEPEEAPPEPGDDEGAAFDTFVGRVRIENTRLTYRDAQAETAHVVFIESFDARAASPSDPLEITLVARYNDEPVEAEIRLEGTVKLLQGAPLGIDLALRAAGASLRAKGGLEHPLEAKGIDLALSVEGESLTDLSALSGSEVPDLGTYRLAGRVRDTDEGYRVDELELRLGDLEAEGELAAALGGERPRLTGSLHLPRLDLVPYQGPPPVSAPPPSGEEPPPDPDARVFSDDPLPDLTALRSIDVDLQLSVDEIRTRQMGVHDFSLDLKLDDGKLQLEPLALTLETGGRISADIALDSTQSKPALETKLDVKGLDVEALIKRLGGSEVLRGGTLDLDADLSGSGSSVRQIVSRLGGRFDVRLIDGVIEDEYAELVFADVGKLVKNKGATDAAKLNCAQARFDVKRGVATADGIVVDTSGLTLFGEGQVKLGPEQLDLHFTREPKSANVTAALPPIGVGGTLAAPAVGVDSDQMGKNVRNTLSSWMSGSSGSGARLGTIKPGAAGCQQLLSYRSKEMRRKTEVQEKRKTEAATTGGGFGGAFKRFRANLGSD